MRRHYCTFFDRNYIFFGLALIESLNRHEKNDFTLFVVCLDEITRIILDGLNLPNVKTIPLHEIELRDFALQKAKKERTLVEYYWTLTPTVLLRLLENHREIDVLTYLDADLCFYFSPDPIFNEMGDGSVLIHEHRFSPSLKVLEAYGKYNVGLVSIMSDLNGMRVVKWWRDRCLEWCKASLEDGKYGDQLYLNSFPEKFSGVIVLENIGAGVGPWNHIQYELSGDSQGRLMVDNVPVIFYHYHSLTFVEPDIILPTKFLTNPMTETIIRLAFLPYIKKLLCAIALTRTVYPEYGFNLTHKGILHDKLVFIAGHNHYNRIKNSHIPQQMIRLDEEWDCYFPDQTATVDAAGRINFKKSEFRQ